MLGNNCCREVGRRAKHSHTYTDMLHMPVSTHVARMLARPCTTTLAD